LEKWEGEGVHGRKEGRKEESRSSLSRDILVEKQRKKEKEKDHQALPEEATPTTQHSVRL